MNWERVLWGIAEFVILTVFAMFVGFVVGLFVKGRQDLILPLAMLIFRNYALYKPT